MESDSVIRKKIFEHSDNVCISSACWRGHVGTRKIEDNRLYLIKLVSDCEDITFELDYVF